MIERKIVCFCQKIEAKVKFSGAQKDLMANMPGKTEVDPEEEKRQQEQLQAMDQAEEERKRKWQKQENQREGMRAGIRDKVSFIR